MTGRLSSWEIVKIVGSFEKPPGMVELSGSLESPSALACAFVRYKLNVIMID